MARTISEIKREMEEAWMANPDVQSLYGFPAGETFADRFGNLSVEGLLMWIVAFCANVLERVFDDHKANVDEALAARTPSTARWYRDQILTVANGQEPACSCCTVDGSGDVVIVKAQQGEAGNRRQLTVNETAAITAWLAENKDAGVKFNIVSLSPDVLTGSMTVYYDPRKLNPAETPVEAVLSDLVANLPFDGLLSVNDIEQALLEVDGVELVHVEQLYTQQDSFAPVAFGLQRRATSGSWELHPTNFTVTYTPYTSTDITA